MADGSIKLSTWVADATGKSKNWAKKAVADGRVDVNGATLTYPTASVVAGDSVTVTAKEEDGGGEATAVVGEPFPSSWPYTPVKGSDGGGGDGKAAKFLHSEAALAKIQHDLRLKDREWLVGYEDRFTGVQELTLDAWNEGLDEGLGSIPTHRVRHLRGDGVIVWERATRLNKLDAFAAGEWP